MGLTLIYAWRTWSLHDYNTVGGASAAQLSFSRFLVHFKRSFNFIMSTDPPAAAAKPEPVEMRQSDQFEHTDELRKIDTVTTSGEDVHGFEATLASLPKGYFFSRFFLGTMMAVGMSLWAGTGAFAYAAAVLTTINEDIGPDPRYVWISLVYNTCLAVFLGPVGRLSDIFGRRYIFIAGAILAVVGSIVCATAQSILVLIGKSR